MLAQCLSSFLDVLERESKSLHFSEAWSPDLLKGKENGQPVGSSRLWNSHSGTAVMDKASFVLSVFLQRWSSCWMSHH